MPTRIVEDVSTRPPAASPVLLEQLDRVRINWLQLTVTATTTLLGFFIFGFALFSSLVMREQPPITVRADGIVVLTGGDLRIVEGSRLLREGFATRLLISGVNARTTRDDLVRLSGLDPKLFDCCVDLGYAAQDTSGNAEETRIWATAHGLQHLIVVTSSYHMPRSLAEIASALPHAYLTPDPVVPTPMRQQAWWLHANATRLLLSEYAKFIPIAGRLLISRMLKSGSVQSQIEPYPPVQKS